MLSPTRVTAGCAAFKPGTILHGTSNGPGRPARGRRSDRRTMVTIVVVVTLGLAAEFLDD